MKTIVGTLLTITILLTTGSTPASAQTPSSPFPAQTATVQTVPDVATKSDLRNLDRKLKTRDRKAEAQRKAEAKAQVAAIQTELRRQAEAQRKAEQMRIAAQAKILKAQHVAEMRMMGGGMVVCIVIVILIATLIMRRNRKDGPAATATETPKRPSRPEDLYGTILAPSQVKQYLSENDLKEGYFTIDLPNEDGRPVFEYRAVVMSNGNVMAFFEGNDRPVALDQLRKVAGKMYREDKFTPINFEEPTGIHKIA
jgi:hypothetical protein